LWGREFIERIHQAQKRGATILFLHSGLGAQYDDALTTVTRAGLAALAEALERETEELGLAATVIESGPIEGSGGEHVLKIVAEQRDEAWPAFHAKWVRKWGRVLSADAKDLAREAIRVACGDLTGVRRHILRVARAAKS